LAQKLHKKKKIQQNFTFEITTFRLCWFQIFFETILFYANFSGYIKNKKLKS